MVFPDSCGLLGLLSPDGQQIDLLLQTAVPKHKLGLIANVVIELAPKQLVLLFQDLAFELAPETSILALFVKEP